MWKYLSTCFRSVKHAVTGRSELKPHSELFISHKDFIKMMEWTSQKGGNAIRIPTSPIITPYIGGFDKIWINIYLIKNAFMYQTIAIMNEPILPGLLPINDCVLYFFSSAIGMNVDSQLKYLKLMMKWITEEWKPNGDN